MLRGRQGALPLHQYVLHLLTVSIFWHICMLPGMPPSCSRSRSMSPDNTGTFTHPNKKCWSILYSQLFVSILLFYELVNNQKLIFLISNILAHNTRLCQGEPEDRVSRELQVRGPGEVPRQPGRHHAAARGGVLEVIIDTSDYHCNMASYQPLVWESHITPPLSWSPVTDM